MEGIKECLLVGSWRPISFLESLEDIYEEVSPEHGYENGSMNCFMNLSFLLQRLRQLQLFRSLR